MIDQNLGIAVHPVMHNLLFVEDLCSPWRRDVNMWNMFILLLRAVGTSKKSQGQNRPGFKRFKNGFGNNFFCLRVAGAGGHWRVEPQTGPLGGEGNCRLGSSRRGTGVYYSSFAWGTLFLFGMMYIIPVLHDVYYSCIAWCILFLFGTMYTIPVPTLHSIPVKLLSYIIPVLCVVP